MNWRQHQNVYRNKDLFEDLENFKLFARAKLNFGKETVCNYVQRIQAFLRDRTIVTNRDVQAYTNEKKEICVPDYVSNIISAFKAFFRDYKRLSFMDGYRHPSGPLRIKEEIEPGQVKAFIEAIDDLGVKSVAVF